MYFSNLEGGGIFVFRSFSMKKSHIFSHIFGPLFHLSPTIPELCITNIHAINFEVHIVSQFDIENEAFEAFTVNLTVKASSLLSKFSKLLKFLLMNFSLLWSFLLLRFDHEFNFLQCVNTYLQPLKIVYPFVHQSKCFDRY